MSQQCNSDDYINSLKKSKYLVYNKIASGQCKTSQVPHFLNLIMNKIYIGIIDLIT